jgi:uncharacterized coiled-coil DUF342 family protein
MARHTAESYHSDASSAIDALLEKCNEFEEEVRELQKERDILAGDLAEARDTRDEALEEIKRLKSMAFEAIVIEVAEERLSN